MKIVSADLVKNLVWDVNKTVIAPRLGQKLPDAEMQIKADGTPVTTVDIEAQTYGTQLLRDAYPDIPVLGEEGYAAQEIRDAVRTAPRVFVGDFVDGTSNLKAGKTNVGSMLHYFEDGCVVATWLCHTASGDVVTADVRTGRVALCNMKSGFSCALRLVRPGDPVEERNIVCGRQLIDDLKRLAVDLTVDDVRYVLKSRSPACGNYMRYFLPFRFLPGFKLFGEDVYAARNFGHISYAKAPLHDHAGGQLALAMSGAINCDYFGQPYDPVHRPDCGLITAIDRGLLMEMQGRFASALCRSAARVILAA